MATFAEIITTLRAEKGKKRQEVADALGISRASLEYYEKGQRKPDYEVLARLANYYGVSADYLIGRTSAKTTDRDIRFVCDYTGMDDTAVQQLHDNIDTPNSICNEILNFFLSNQAEFDFLRLCENFENYKQSYEENSEENLRFYEFCVERYIGKLIELYSQI